MDLSARLVSIGIELVFVPAVLDEKKCREIFDRISDSHSIASYQSLPDGSVLMSSKNGKNNLTRYRIAKDRLIINYEQCGQSVNYYQALSDDFIKVFSAVTGNTLFLMHSVVLRKLAGVQDVEDGRGFLAKNVLSLDDDKFKPFARPLHVIGLRMFFPPLKDQPAGYDVKIESLMEDYRTIFIECTGIFSTPADINADSTAISRDIAGADDFINNNVAGFLEQFRKNAV
jgi:hypothetical protein